MIDNETPTNGISLPPHTIVGYRENGMPVYNIAGGSGDVSSELDDETDVDNSADTDDGDEDSPDIDAWTPPSREDYERLLNEKKKADSEAAARKRFLREAGLDPKTGKPVEKPKVDLELDDLEDTDEVDSDDKTEKKAEKGFSKEQLEKQLQRTLEREVAKTEQRVRQQTLPLIYAVPQALEDAGWNGKNLPRMLKLLDLDSVEVHSDGDIEGLNEQVDELKKDFPEFFKRSRMKDVVKDVADSGTVGGGKKKAPASEEDQDWKTRMKNQILRG